METISIQDVIRSQSRGLINKREMLAHRLYVAEGHSHAYLPRKRVRPQRSPFLSERVLASIVERMRMASRRRFASTMTGSGVPRLAWFHAGMLPLVLAFKLARRMRGLASRVRRSLRR
jgi:hypothetical protein